MAVLFDSVGTTGLTNASRTVAGSPYTYTHTTVAPGATVILGFAIEGAGSLPWSSHAPTAVTCGGTTMRFLGMRGNNDVANATGFVAAYACTAPNVGANTVSVTMATTAECWAQTVAYTGARGINIRDVNSGSSTNPTTGAIASAVDHMVWSILGTASQSVSAATQTERFIQSGTTFQSGGIQDAVGAPTVTTGYTAATAAWATLSLDLSDTTGTMGFDSTGGTVDSGNQGFLQTIKCYLPIAATVSSISLNVPTVNGNVYYYIYADSAGVPGALLGVTDLFTPAGTGWVTRNLTSQLDLAAGVYWIGFTPTNSLMQYSRTADKDAVADILSVASTFSTPPPPNPFGSTQVYAGGTHSIYATYTAIPVVPNSPIRISNPFVGPQALRHAMRGYFTTQPRDSDSGVVALTGTSTSTDITVGLTADGVVDAGIASPQLIIPNRFVGPMALRAGFRRAQPGITGPDAFYGDDVDTGITVGLTSDAVVGVVGSASTAITVGLSAAGAVGASSGTTTAVTVGLSADGVVGVVGAVDTPVTVGLTADGSVVTSDTGLPAAPLQIPNRNVGPQALRQAFRRADRWTVGPDAFYGTSTDLSITVGLTAAAVVGTIGDASTAITVGVTAAGAVGVATGSTATAITVGLTAAGAVGAVGTATTAITVGLTATGVVGIVTSSVDTAITVGVSADGVNPASVVDSAPTPFSIPNRNVGPMALRQAFRRAQPWLDQLTAYSVGSVTTAVTVGLTASGVVGVVAQTTTTAVTVGLTGVGVVSAVAQTTTSITVGLTASGLVGVVGQTTTSITVGLTATGIAAATGTAGATTSITIGLTAVGLVEIIVPPNRSCAVKAESRTAAIRVESRTVAIKPESRTATVRPESRTVAVRPESRTVDV